MRDNHFPRQWPAEPKKRIPRNSPTLRLTPDSDRPIVGGATLAEKEETLADNSKEAQVRAEASFKKQEQRAREGAKATAEYEAASLAMREKTARLKSLRLAKVAAEMEDVKDEPVTLPKKAPL